MSLIWYQTCVDAECIDCGEKKVCTRITGEREQETGYVDEYDICSECWAKRHPYYDPWD